MKVLLHACCAPCSIYCAELISSESLAFDLYWFNPNIHPADEYQSRLDSFRTFAYNEKLDAIIEEDDAAFDSAVEWPDGRCAFCYRLRLEKTARFAAEKGYDAFSTSLLISPYQNHELLKQTGEELAALYDVKFFYRDFRIGFRPAQKKAREAGYYMQKYCGCIFSKEERYGSAKVNSTGQGAT